MHLGIPKTATSSLQKFFNENSENLISDSIIYPINGRIFQEATNHFRLYFCFRDQNHFLCPKDINNPSLEWGRVLEEGISYKSDILVSCEAFLDLSNADYLFIQNLVKNVYNLRFIVYLRRIDHHISSWVNQAIKQETLTNTKISLEHTTHSRKLIYDKLTFLSTVFGPKNVIVRPFEINRFLNKNIFDDFLYYGLGLRDNQKYNKNIKTENTNLGKYSLAFKLKMNELGFRPNQMVQIGNALQNYSKLHDEPPPDLLSTDEKIFLINSVRKEEEWISSNLLIPKHEELFDYTIHSSNKLTISSIDLTLLKIIEISKFVLSDSSPEKSALWINFQIFQVLVITIITNKFSKSLKINFINQLVKSVLRFKNN